MFRIFAKMIVKLLDVFFLNHSARVKATQTLLSFFKKHDESMRENSEITNEWLDLKEKMKKKKALKRAIANGRKDANK